MRVQDEIKKLFDERMSDLKNGRKENLRMIADWATKSKKHIDECAASEKQRLEQHCASSRKSLEEDRRRYAERAGTDEMKKNKEQAAQLLEECQQLQFKLATLESYQRNMTYVAVDIPDDSGREGLRNGRPGRKTSREGSAKDQHANGIVNHENAASADAKSASQSRRSSMTQTSPDLSRSKRDPDQIRTRNEDGDEAIDKCPVCFMIFSHSMDRQDREQHVNDHYGDD